MAMTTPVQQNPICRLCGNFAESTQPLYSQEGRPRTARRIECRICGTYDVTWMMETSARTFDREDRYRLSGLTRTASEEGRILEITTEGASALLEENPDPSPVEQADLVLEYLAKHSRPPGKPVPIQPDKDYTIARAHGAEALQFILRSLVSDHLIERTDTSAVPQFRVTMKGYQHLQRRQDDAPSAASTEFDELTDEQQTLLLALGRELATSAYHSEFFAAATFGKGWFAVLSPKDGSTEPKEISGFEETDLHALRDRHYLTLIRNKSGYAGSLTRKGQEVARRHRERRPPITSDTQTPTVTGPIPFVPVASPPSLTIGSTFGHYTVLEELGRGGMGVVYKVRDTRLDEIVALKTLSDTALRDPKHRARFHSEIRLARKVSHPYICRIHEFGEDNGVAYFTMEFIEGPTLKKQIRDHGPLPSAQVLDIALQIAEGLQHLHDKGIVHRDLKSSNVMRDDRGDVRLMDFGIAKDTSPDATQTASDALLGTVEYMSPEHLGGRRVDVRSDLYAFGILLYELLVGQVPYRGRPEQIILQHLQSPPPLKDAEANALSPAWKAILARCLAKAPDDRYATAADLAAALRGLKASPTAAPSTASAIATAPPTAVLAQKRGQLRESLLVALYEANAYAENDVAVHEIASAEALKFGTTVEEGVNAFQYLVDRQWAVYTTTGPHGMLTVDGVDAAEQVLLKRQSS